MNKHKQALLTDDTEAERKPLGCPCVIIEYLAAQRRAAILAALPDDISQDLKAKIINDVEWQIAAERRYRPGVSRREGVDQ